MLAPRGSIALAEVLEDQFALVRVDADARVTHGETELAMTARALLALDRELDLAAVGEQLPAAGRR